MVCSSDDIAGQGLQGVDPGADIDGPRAAVVDDQHGRATRDRLGRPGKIRLGTAANPEDDFTWALNAAGGNGDNADGANQGFVPGHDQPLLTMPDCRQHTLSPADTSLTWTSSRTKPTVLRMAAAARRGVAGETVGAGRRRWAKAGRSGEEGELASRGTQGPAVRLGERLPAGSLERGGDVAPGIRERGTQEPGEHPPYQGQRTRIRIWRPGQVHGQVQVVHGGLDRERG